MQKEIRKIIEQFDIDGSLINIGSKNNGNINKTYIATYKMQNGEEKKFIIQKINTTVFKEPYKVMKNIENITNWIEKKSRLYNDKHPCLKVIPTKKHKNLAVISNENGEKQYFRAYNCIENAISYEVSKDKSVVYNTGKAFGYFQKMLIDYPICELEETIADFHNTPKRYRNFLNDIDLDVCDRVYEVSKEISFVLKNSSCASIITDLIDKGRIPIRVTHNDTKVNNVMMDEKTGGFLAVIDLDTVMKGSSLYDYGDGVRSAASNSSEDEQNLDNVFINCELFESYTDGYLSEMAPFLTLDEVRNMGSAIEVITFELGLRFLNDYINGDTYFKINYDKHNLIRARNQFKLLMDIKEKLAYINQYTLDSYQKIMKK